MSERPIIFKGDMVRAVLAGAKTQTRRVIKMPPSWDCFVMADFGGGWWPYKSDDGESPTWDNSEIPLNCPYGKAGDQLWLRETWQVVPEAHTTEFIAGRGTRVIDTLPGGTVYRADRDNAGLVPVRDGRRTIYVTPKGPWQPSIHMPRSASRATLMVNAVRAERLHDISEADAQAEGFLGPMTGTDWMGINQVGRLPSACYRLLWEKIHGPATWEANPWVWVIDFARVIP